MKTSTLLIQIGILLAGAMASAKGVDASMSGFNLKACSSDHTRCVEVKAEKTQGSQMKMLHSLSKPEVTITSAKKNEVLKADSGYIDMDENQVVLYQKANGHLQEISINLNTFQKTAMDVGNL